MIMNRKPLIRAAQIVFSVSFLLLLWNRVVDYQTAYLKFALIDFVYSKNLGFLFYFFGLIEAALAVAVFFANRKIGRFITDLGLLLYLPFLLTYYLLLLKESAGCIECNYTTHFLGEDIKLTAGVLLTLAALYYFFIRSKFRRST